MTWSFHGGHFWINYSDNIIALIACKFHYKHDANDRITVLHIFFASFYKNRDQRIFQPVANI